RKDAEERGWRNARPTVIRLPGGIKAVVSVGVVWQERRMRDDEPRGQDVHLVEPTRCVCPPDVDGPLAGPFSQNRLLELLGRVVVVWPSKAVGFPDPVSRF